MSDIWEDLAAAVASRLEFERRCNRLGFVDEFTTVRFAAEFLDSKRRGKIRTEEPHPDIPKKFIDLVRETPRGLQFDLGMEAKWLRESGSVRPWLKEVAVDLFRLQHFRSECRQGTHRVLLVAGSKAMVRSQLFERTVQTGGGSVLGLPFVLPDSHSAKFKQFHIRDGDAAAQKWLRGCQKDLGVNLPTTYEARLAARFLVCEDDDAIETIVWVTRRRQNWRSFNIDTAWGKV